MTPTIPFKDNQGPSVSAVGKISLTKPRLHMDQVAPMYYLIYVLSGTFFVSEEEDHYSIKEGQVFFRMAGRHHYSKTYMSPGCAWFWVSFTLDEMDGEPDHHLPQLIDVHDRSTIFKRLGDMLQLYQSNLSYKTQQLGAELTAIFYHLLREQSNPHTGNEMIVQAVDKQLAAMIHGPFEAKKIASALRLDYSYIGKCYKADTGMTINHRFNALKVQKAIGLIQDGRESITEISDTLGYANPFYFSRVFKKHTGISPSLFIKNLY